MDKAIQKAVDKLTAPNQRAHFPRKDIKQCIKEDDEISDVKCPKCGKYMIHIYFSSPAWTWKNLCGRAGPMDVCTNCKRGYNFFVEEMN